MENKTIKKRRYEIVIESSTTTRGEAQDYIKNILNVSNIKINSMKCLMDYRSLEQNNALHLWFTQLADEFNEKGIDMRLVIKPDIKIPASPMFLKENIWRPVQIAMFNKKSTTQLFKSKEIDQIYDIINQEVIERFKGEVVVPPFPDRTFWGR